MSRINEECEQTTFFFKAVAGEDSPERIVEAMQQGAERNIAT